MADTPRVRAIRQRDDRTLEITWTTGRTMAYDVVALRRGCPCAGCVDETTGRRTLEPGAVADTVRPVEVTNVGRYALHVAFDDGHRDGVYSFSLLHDRWPPAGVQDPPR